MAQHQEPTARRWGSFVLLMLVACRILGGPIIHAGAAGEHETHHGEISAAIAERHESNYSEEPETEADDDQMRVQEKSFSCSQTGIWCVTVGQRVLLPNAPFTILV